MKTKFEQAVEGQLEAYNAHNIEDFLQWYTEDVKGIDMDTEAVLFVGKEQMRAIYNEKFKNEYLYCKLANRMVLHRSIVDHEHVTLHKDKEIMQAIAIYEMEESGLINKVSFTKGKL